MIHAAATHGSCSRLVFIDTLMYMQHSTVFDKP